MSGKLRSLKSPPPPFLLLLLFFCFFFFFFFFTNRMDGTTTGAAACRWAAIQETDNTVSATTRDDLHGARPLLPKGNWGTKNRDTKDKRAGRESNWVTTCSSSPPTGGITSSRQSTRSAAAVSDWPTPTVSTSTWPHTPFPLSADETASHTVMGLDDINPIISGCTAEVQCRPLPAPLPLRLWPMWPFTCAHPHAVRCAEGARTRAHTLSPPTANAYARRRGTCTCKG
jgi:hypothetical protein